jgi:monofunctional biosynthetic peptidoglycan transglycosylase
LTRSEAALLAAVLPAPTRFKVGAPSHYVKKRQAWILRQMNALGGTSYLAQFR